MKRLIRLAALVCCALTLAACAAPSLGGPRAPATLVPGVDTVLPEAEAPPSLDGQAEATLYFRYLDEPYLAPETRTITVSPSQPYELSLLTALLSGPGTRSSDLRALFPAGTRVRSTVTQGRTLFVTLSRQIMNRYADEPEDWPDDPAWAFEAPLRRRLCMQSLVATVTENCDVDQVQILVEQDGAVTDSLRLRQEYFLDGGTGLVGPMTRDETMLLTPDVALDVALSLWRERDWLRLYRYLARHDPVTGDERVSYDDFVAKLESLPALTDYAFAGGSVQHGGARATYTLSASVMVSGGQTEEIGGRVIRLCREGGLWRVSLDQLTGWLEVRP